MVRWCSGRSQVLLEREAWLARRGGHNGCTLAGEERICQREGLLEVLVVRVTRDASVKVKDAREVES